jgi:hypothetical protein
LRPVVSDNVRFSVKSGHLYSITHVRFAPGDIQIMGPHVRKVPEADMYSRRHSCRCTGGIELLLVSLDIVDRGLVAKAKNAFTRNAATMLHRAMITKWCPEKPCLAMLVSLRAPGMVSPEVLNAFNDPAKSVGNRKKPRRFLAPGH